MTSPIDAIDVLGLGCAAVDDILYVDAFPPPDSKVRVQSRERYCGGLTATALVAAARLGAKCAYAGPLGPNEPSEFVRRQLEGEGVDLSLVYTTPEAQPVQSTIVVDSTGKTRTIFFHLGEEEPLPEAWPPRAAIEGVRALFVDNFHVAAQYRAARAARQREIPVIGDFEDDGAAGFAELMEITDHLIISRIFARRLTGIDDPARAVRDLWCNGRQAVIVTCGADGCWLAAHPSSSPGRTEPPTVEHLPAHPVEAVDTTGCGDVFHGAYAAELVLAGDVRRAAQVAGAAAALKATRRGGLAGAPTRREVDLFLKGELCLTQR